MKDWQPIFTRILDSQINEEAPHIRWLFVVMLLLKDADHVVHMSKRALIKRANISEQEFDDAIQVLMAENPDDEDDQRFSGRMVEKTRDGWLVLNGEKYGELTRSQWLRERKNISQNQIRAAQRQASDMTHHAAESAAEPGRINVPEPARHNPAGNCVKEFEQFYTAYPRKLNREEAARAFVDTKAAPHIDKILKALKWQKGSNKWSQDGGQYIPSPAKYLRDLAWQEEPSSEDITPEQQREKDLESTTRTLEGGRTMNVAGLTWTRKSGGPRREQFGKVCGNEAQQEDLFQLCRTTWEQWIAIPPAKPEWNDL